MIDHLSIARLPIKIIAQRDKVTIFQTAAFSDSENDGENHGADSTLLQQQQRCQPAHTSYGQLNLGLHVNDDAAQVLDNRMRVLAAINEQLAAPSLTASSTLSRSSIKCLHWVNQVHGTQIYDVDKTVTSTSMRPVDADAMVSAQAGLGLAIMTADCVPIVLYQPATGQIAAIHAGWQGLAQGVIKATAERFDSSMPIMAWIGVCISQANYEVSSPVYEQLLAGCIASQSLTGANIDHFKQRYATFEECIEPEGHVEAEYLHQSLDKSSNMATLSPYASSATDKVRLNLPKLASDQLLAAGITIHTDLPLACSYADTRYYSYRRQTHLQQRATGRMALIIVRHTL